MRRAAYALTALFTSSLIAFSAYSWPRRVDSAAAEHYEQELRTLVALDFRMSAEILRAGSGLSAHYDGIVQTGAARKRAHRALRELPSFLQGRAEMEVRYLLDVAERVRTQAETLIERFKREHAILRNSLRYLPVLARDVDRIAPANQAARRSQELIRDSLLLQTVQDPQLLSRVDSELEWLEIARKEAPEAPHALFDSVLAHARIVRERTPLVQELTRGILRLDAPSATAAVMTAFIHRRQAAVEIADTDASRRFALIVLSLLAAAACVVLEFWNKAERLRLTSLRLAQTVSWLRIEQQKQAELSELKNQFVSVVSHEFRTPLTVILSSVEMLEAYAERWPVAKQHEHFRRIREKSTSMKKLLEGVLAIGSHEKGLIKFKPEPLEIGRLCGEILDSVDDVANHRRRVVYHGPEADQPVMADPALLRHMLENLLTNALKYSGEDTDIELSVAHDDRELRLEVKDHGIGIAEDDLRHLFENFYRGHNVGSVSGTGLGLSIVRDAVELHGGQLAVRSQLHVGTSFTISIPCPRSRA